MLGKTRVEVEVAPRDGGLDVVFAEAGACASTRPGRRASRSGAATSTSGRSRRRSAPILNGFEIIHGGAQATARVYTVREAELAALMIERKGADTSKALLCPMPGLVKSIAVKVGQEVKAGEPLCMVEAMKMENVLLAERDVTVGKILAKEGDSLAVDAVIMEFA